MHPHSPPSPRTFELFPYMDFLTVSSRLKIALPGCGSWGETVYADPSNRSTVNS